MRARLKESQCVKTYKTDFILISQSRAEALLHNLVSDSHVCGKRSPVFAKSPPLGPFSDVNSVTALQMVWHTPRAAGLKQPADRNPRRSEKIKWSFRKLAKIAAVVEEWKRLTESAIDFCSFRQTDFWDNCPLYSICYFALKKKKGGGEGKVILLVCFSSSFPSSSSSSSSSPSSSSSSSAPNCVINVLFNDLFTFASSCVSKHGA